MRRILLFLVCAGSMFALALDADAQGKKKAKPPIWSDQKDAFGDPLPIGAVARIGTVRYRLPEGRGILNVAVSADAALIAAVSEEHTIDVWELPAWKHKRTITGRSLDKNGGQIQGLTFSADGKKLVTSDINFVKLYLIDAATGKSIKKISLSDKQAVRDPFLALSRDEQTLVCAFIVDNGKGPQTRVYVWDLAKDKLRVEFTLESAPPGMMGGVGDPLGGRAVVSADCRWLARSANNENPNRPGRGLDSRLEIWDLTTGKLARKIEVDLPLPHLALSPDGKWLAAGSEASLLRIYDAAAGKELHNIRGRNPIQHVQFSPDSSALFVADYSGGVQRWDPAKGERTDSWKSPERIGASQFLFPPQGKMLAINTLMQAVRLWEVESGKFFSPKNLPADAISEVEFSPQGELFVATEGGMNAWWNARTGAKIRDLKLENPDAENGVAGMNLMSGRLDGIIDIPPRRSRRGGSLGFEGAVIGMTPNGQFAASSFGNGITFHDAKTGKFLYEDGAGEEVTDIAFLDGGARSASMYGKKVRIWNTRTGRDTASFAIPLRDQEFSSRFAASAGGKYFAIQINSQAENGAGRLVLFDAEQKNITREWPTAPGLTADMLVFSPDQTWLAIGRPQEGVLLSRVGASRGDHELPGDKSGDGSGPDFMQAIFSPDSRQLACATTVFNLNDQGVVASRLRIYEVASKKVRLELIGHPGGEIERLAYSPDGALLASGATDTTALVWKAGLRGFADKPVEDVPAADLDAAYKKMAGSDAKAAFQAMIQLARSPAQTVKLLEEKIAPAKTPESGDKSIKQWIHDLGSSQFAVRTKANQVLQKLGPTAEMELKQALPKTTDIETRRRIEELLDRIALRAWTAEEILHARAVELVESIGTAEALALLGRWSKGDGGAILTIEARKAIAATGR